MIARATSARSDRIGYTRLHILRRQRNRYRSLSELKRAGDVAREVTLTISLNLSSLRLPFKREIVIFF